VSRAVSKALHVVYGDLIKAGVKTVMRQRDKDAEQSDIRMQRSIQRSDGQWTALTASLHPFTEVEDISIQRLVTRSITRKICGIQWLSVCNTWREQYRTECMAQQVNRRQLRSSRILRA